MKTEDIISEVDTYILGTYSRIPLTIKEGKGSWVWDNDGKKFLDFTTGIAVTNLGHNHSVLTGVIKNQAEKILHSSNLFYLESQAKLAKMLVENSFANKVFFCNTGTEAVEGQLNLQENGEVRMGKNIKFSLQWAHSTGVHLAPLVQPGLQSIKKDSNQCWKALILCLMETLNL